MLIQITGRLVVTTIDQAQQEANGTFSEEVEASSAEGVPMLRNLRRINPTSASDVAAATAIDPTAMHIAPDVHHNCSVDG